MRSLTLYALAYPFLVAADPIDYAAPKDGKYDLSNINWNTVSYTNGFGGYGGGGGGGGGGGQPSPTPTPNSGSGVQNSPAQNTDSSTASQPSGTDVSQPSSTSDTSSQPSSSDTSSDSSGSSSGSCPQGAQTVTIENKSGKDLHVAPGFPWVAKGNSFDCSVISNGDSCTTCQATGLTGGNLQLGYGSSDGCARGSWIEGNSLTTPCVDISYIPGYSVPVKCTSHGPGGGQTVGSMEALCNDESCSNCSNGGGKMQSGSCQNPAGDSGNPLQNGPSPSFFQKVEKDAYTYPAGDSLGNNPNNKVVAYGASWISMTCTAGSPMGGSSKRDVLPEVGQMEKREPEPLALEDVLAPKVVEKREPIISEPEVQRPSAHRHIGKRHGKRRHGHAHAAVEESI